jgi:hypothetical protein
MNKTYDIEMIRDFIEHLKWELRIKHLENTRRMGTQHPELSDQLKKYVQKRNTKGLLYANRIDKAGLAKDKTQEVIKVIREGSAIQAQEALDALGVLEPILEEALDCTSRPDDFLTRTINLVAFLKHMEEQEDQQG